MGVTGAPAGHQPLVVAHRGASGSRIEHTVAAYQLAMEAGADVLELDLVVSADGELVVRHDIELSASTDVAQHPRFADRRRTLSVDGDERTGWFVHDFTLDELRELRCVERWPERRPDNVAFDGLLPLVTFDEAVQLAIDGGRRRGSPVPVWPELKSPSHFADRGLDPVPLLVDALRRHGLDRGGAPVLVQCFESSALRRVAEAVPAAPRLQLLESGSRPFDAVVAGDDRTFDDRVTDDGIAEMAGYATCLGIDKGLFAAVLGDSSNPGGLVELAHRHGLDVFAWTFRDENAFLPDDLRIGNDPAGHGNAVAEYHRYFDAGVVGAFSDHPATAVAAREQWQRFRQRE